MMFNKISTYLLALTIIFLSANKAEAFNFDQCMDKARLLGNLEMARCKQIQNPIELNALKQEYNEVAGNPKLKNAISPDDLKKMYNAWKIYRDIYCKSLSEAYRKNPDLQNSTQEYTNDISEYYYQHCLQELTVNAKEYISALQAAVVFEEHGH